MELSKFKSDVEKVENGTWIDLGDGLHICVARTGNKKSVAMFNKLTKPYRQMIERGTMPDDKYRELNVKIVAETILLGWEGLFDKGTEVPYSPEKAAEILSDPAYAGFLKLVQDLSGEEEVFRFEEAAAIKKKSSST